MFTGEFKPANSTTARKPGNDMKKNKTINKMGDSPAAWQKADKGLGFDGMDNGSSQRASAAKRSSNPAAGFSNPDSIQMRQMPNKKGNYADQSNNTRVAPCVASGVGVTGSRSWAPSAGQNYKGNPDQIQDRQLYNNKGNKD